MCYVFSLSFSGFFFFHQTGSEPMLSSEPVLSVLTITALAPALKNSCYNSTNSLLFLRKEPLTSSAVGGVMETN